MHTPIYPKHKNTSKKSYTKRIIIVILLNFSFLFFRAINSKVQLPENKILVQKGDTINTIINNNFSGSEKFFFKIYNKIHSNSGKIYPGIHQFTGTEVSKSEFLQNLASKPKINELNFTILEGRSIYDIDDSLAKKGLIQRGEYRDATRYNMEIRIAKFPFLASAWNIKNLEGFLMPDTYRIRENKIIDDLITLQLKNFEKKVRTPYISEIKNHKLDLYKLVTLASIVEKEEKNSNNKSTVAGIFMNRIDKNMLLWADITLCYNFKKPYTSCTSKLINEKVYDKSNPYNTRMNGGLTPTPIGNPSAETILSVLNYKKTPYLYYLHNVKSWQIYYGKTLEEHNKNKQYL